DDDDHHQYLQKGESPLVPSLVPLQHARSAQHDVPQHPSRGDDLACFDRGATTSRLGFGFECEYCVTFVLRGCAPFPRAWKTSPHVAFNATSGEWGSGTWGPVVPLIGAYQSFRALL